eukprot:3501520-Amphidinium_carterae.1
MRSSLCGTLLGLILLGSAKARSQSVDAAPTRVLSRRRKLRRQGSKSTDAYVSMASSPEEMSNR